MIVSKNKEVELEFKDEYEDMIVKIKLGKDSLEFYSPGSTFFELTPDQFQELFNRVTSEMRKEYE